MSEYTKPAFALAGFDLALIAVVWGVSNKKITDLEKKIETLNKEIRNIEVYMKCRTPSEKIRGLEERLARLERAGPGSGSGRHEPAPRTAPIWDAIDDDEFDAVAAVVSQTRSRG